MRILCYSCAIAMFECCWRKLFITVIASLSVLSTFSCGFRRHWTTYNSETQHAVRHHRGIINSIHRRLYSISQCITSLATLFPISFLRNSNIFSQQKHIRISYPYLISYFGYNRLLTLKSFLYVYIKRSQSQV
jgi:hypothetical protein